MAEAGAATAQPRSLVDTWITPDLLARTRQVWGDHLGEPMSEADALEILQTVRRMTVLAMRTLRDEDQGGEAGIPLHPPP